MAEQLSAEMAQSFEKAINPTFQKMDESLDVLTESVTSCQQDGDAGDSPFFPAGDERLL